MRYSRQLVLDEIGKKGQNKLAKASIVLVGSGALGSNSAELLARTGIGTIYLVDNEQIELSNLQRQALFTEKDIGKYKVDVAKEKLLEINSTIKVKVSKEYLNRENIGKLISKTDLVLDCTDNLQTRFLINDYCAKKKIKWIYSAAIKTVGNVFNVIPGKPCLSCFVKNNSDIEKCEDVGVLNTIINIISAIQVTESIKILTGTNYETNLVRYDIWKNDFSKIKISKNKKCQTCNGKYKFLEGKEDFFIKHCKSKAAYSVKPNKRVSLKLNKIKKEFKIKVESSLLLVLDIEGGIIVHKFGELLFKKLTDEKKIKEISEKIYSIGK